MTSDAPIARNAPCPCGSGRRYKACHGAPGGAAAVPVEATLRAALAAHEAGRLDEAAALYDDALAREPALFDALHMRGVVEYQRGGFQRAVELIGRAAALRPDVADAARNLDLARAALAGAAFTQRYRAWIDRVEQPRVAARTPLRRAAAARAGAPRFSILLPTFDTPEPLLHACLDSVLAQEWPHWELCIADDASTLPHVRRVLAAYAARDARVRVALRASNGHIARATNSALELATAPYVALLDHDDVLPAHALAEVALEIAAHPDAAVVYSDEDKLDHAGARFEPYLKPDWNPRLLLAQNCVSHLGVYRTSLVREVGGFRAGTEGAQDWDLALRCTERAGARAIRHVPQVLYHWRAAATSTAHAIEAKAYAPQAQERVVRDAFARRGRAVHVARAAHAAFVEAEPRPDRVPRASLVLLDGPGGDADAWRRAAGASLADLASVACAPAQLDGRARTVGRAAAAALDAAVARARGDVVVVGDARFAPPDPPAFTAWLAHAVEPDNGPVGALLADARGAIAGGWLLLDPETVARVACFGAPAGWWGMAGRGALVQNVAAVGLDAMAVRADTWRRLGGLAAGLAARYHDVDFCLRAREAGLLPVWHPGVRLGAAATCGAFDASAATEADAARMRERWGAALVHDPSYPDDLARGPRWFDFT